MKNYKLVIIVLVLAGIAGLVWLKLGGTGGGEGEVVPEVAVHVSKVIRTTLHSYVTAYGTVEPEPPGERPAAGAKLGPLASGVVAAVDCREGQAVEKGAVLVRLDSRAADAAVVKAQDAVSFAEKTVERQKTLIKVEGTSQRRLLDAEQALAAARGELASARAQQAYMRVTSPLTGTVLKIDVRPGEAVDQSTVLVELADLDRLVARASVPSAELDGLDIGQGAEVTLDDVTPPVSGILNYIGSRVDLKTGAAEVRVALPAGCGLLPGEFVKLRIVSSEHEGCLAVPVESVVQDEEDNPVIALVQGDVAVLKPVKVGLRDEDLVEVEAIGLQAGMTVVTAGAYGLPDGTKVRSVGQ